ncbi:MAG: hypothetical protein VX438_14625 [Planctomycetota bacterium]|nr:hypothetical protein [Planctomycetota bacterium]
MRSILFSTALIFTAITMSGCATLKVESRLKTDEQAKATAAPCGLAACRDPNCRLGTGRIAAGMSRLAPGFGRLAPGFGRLGNRETQENHAPYTADFNGPSGPATGTFSYPYYTTRAPRDFLMANPPSIGR